MINFINPSKLYTRKAKLIFLPKAKKFKYISIISLVLAISLGLGLSSVFGTNTIVQSLNNNVVCNIHNTCPSQILGVASFNIPQSGEYEVRLDISLNSIDEQLNESLYISFSHNSLELTPIDPNAGIYRVIPDVPGASTNLDAYAGLFNLPAGTVNLNVYHYTNIWNDYPQFKNGNDFSGPESVYIESIKLIPQSVGPCEIQLTKKDNTPFAEPGGEINYTIDLTNTGSQKCTGFGVLLEDIFDPQTVFTSADTAYWQNVPVFLAGRDLWNFGTLEPGDSREVNLTVKVSDDAQDGDTITNKACVWAAQLGIVTDENNWQCVTVDTPVKEPEPVFCELNLTKEALPAVVAPGDDLLYTIKLENTGTANCTGGGVELTEYYDDLTNFIASDPVPFANNDLWNFGIIEPGEKHQVEIQTKVSQSAQEGDTITNKACVWASEFGIKSDNNSWHCVTVDTPVEVENICVDNGLPQPKINPLNPTVTIGETVNFDALGSTDPENDTLEFTWLVNGNEATTTSNNFSFTPGTVGEYEISLTAKDQCGLNTTSTSLTVNEPESCLGNENPEPVITPADPTITLGNSVTFSSSDSTDADGDSLNFEWLVDGVSQSMDADFEYTSNSVGIFTIELRAQDQCGEATQSTTLTVNNSGGGECLGNNLPVAQAGQDLAGLVGESFILDGSASTDADGDALTYTWSVPSAGFTAQTATTSISFSSPNPEKHIAILTVSDGCGSSTDTVELNVHNGGGGGGPVCTSQRPEAVAGQDISADPGQEFTLDASLSLDPENDIQSYLWKIDSINFEAHTATTSLSIAKPGKYIATLTVADACSLDDDTLEIEIIGGPPCPDCGGGPPVNPPTTTPPNIKPPGVVLGEATSTVGVFTAPPTSPRAGSGLPLAQMAIGLLSGVGVFIATYLLYRKKEARIISQKSSL